MLNKNISASILSEIKKAQSILLVFHVSPDGDCVGSVLALNLFLEKLAKKTTIFSASKIPQNFGYLPEINLVEIQDFSKIDFSQFDLFIALDCAQESMITRKKYPERFPKKFKIINIDHHYSNSKFGDINLIDAKASSVSEMIFTLFKNWRVMVDKQMAQLLFLGIFSDTGCFQYPAVTKKTLEIASELMAKGADLNQTVLMQYRSYDFKTLKYWCLVLKNMQLDVSGKFIWSKVSLQEIKELGIKSENMEGASNLFCPVTLGTEFGIILDESEGFIKGSLRSRAGFDVSKIAEQLGGGGHKLAAGFVIKNCSLKEAEEKVLEVTREKIKNLLI